MVRFTPLTFQVFADDHRSRDIVTSPHCSLLDPASNDVLTTVYHALLTSTLLTWSPQKVLNADTFVAFIQSVLERLPSSSGTVQSPNITSFGELIVDLVWSIDAELEEVLYDAKTVTVKAEQGNLPLIPGGNEEGSQIDVSTAIARVIKASQDAEADKETLASIVRKLLVRVQPSPMSSMLKKATGGTRP